MAFIRLQKQISPISIDKNLSSTYIFDHTKGIKKNIFHYKTSINLTNEVKLNEGSQYHIVVILSKINKEKFIVKNGDLVNGSYLNNFAKHKLNVASALIKRRYNNVKIMINKAHIKSSEPYPIEFNISSERLVGDRVFQLNIIEVTADKIERVIDKLEISHNDKQKIYEIPSDNFNFNFSIINRTSVAVEAFTKDKRIGGFNILVSKVSTSTSQRQNFITAGKIYLFNDATLSKRLLTASIGNTEIIDSISLSYSLGSIQISLDTDESYVIRVLPFSSISSTLFGNFKQKILTGKKRVTLGNVPFYISDKSNNSLSATVLSAPNDAVRVSLHRKNLTLKDRDFIKVATAAMTGNIVLTDSGFFDRYNYEYKTSYDTIDGLTKKLTIASQVAHATRLGQNITLSIKKQAVQNLSSNMQIKFNISSSFNVVSSLDSLKTDLDALGLGSIFEDNIINVANNIQPLIKIVVSRISTLTGLETYIGLFSPGDITIDCPKSPFIFRFEATIRSSVELIESIAANQALIAKDQKKIGGLLSQASAIIGQKVSSDLTNYTGKFLTKTAIVDSTLRYGNASLPIDYDFELGRTGIVRFLTISVNSDPSSISNIKAIRSFDGIKIQSTIRLNDINDIKHISIKNGKSESRIFPTKSGNLAFFAQSDISSKEIIISAIGYNDENVFTSMAVV